jgi:hypothetical protein
MKRKSLLIVLLLVLGLVGIGASSTRLVRFKVINKSGRKIEVSLTGIYYENFYYLHIDEGSQLFPAQQVFTIIPDSYTSSVYYFELWDPVYGNQCGTQGQTLDVSRNVTLTVLECNISPSNGGEQPAMVKLGGQNRKRGR